MSSLQEPDTTPMVRRFISNHVGRAEKCGLQLKAKTLEINCVYKVITFLPNESS